MSTSPKSVRFDDDSMWVELTDGRALGIPLDEDISLAGLLASYGDCSHSVKIAA
jgi:hypothetical protein